MISRAELEIELHKTKFKLSDENTDILCGYLNLLMQWNKKMNLIGAKNWKEALHNLIIDSFYLADFIQNVNIKEEPISLDLGAGAGLPGIMLRALWSTGSYTMIESRQKRAIFLATVMANYPLKNTFIYEGRVESFFAAQTKKANIIFSRAFMPYLELIDLVKNNLANEHLIVFLAKEKPVQAKLPDIILNDKKLKCQISNIVSYIVDGDTRYIWSVHFE